MDMEQLVDAVTKTILERLNGNGPKVVAFGEVPQNLLCPDATIKKGENCADLENFDYIVMTLESFRSFHGDWAQGTSDCCCDEPAPSPAQPAAQTIDLTGKRLIHERDLRDHNTRSGDVVRVGRNAIVTALAHDYAKGVGAKIVRE